MRDNIKEEFDPAEDISADIITLIDENDQEVMFEILGHAEYNEQSYMAAMEYFEDPQEALEAEPYVYIFREGVDDEEGFATYDIVDDDEELYDVQEIFKDILSDYFDWE